MTTAVNIAKKTTSSKNIPAHIQEKIDWTITYMAINDRFGYEILSMMERIVTDEIDTMAVRCRGSKIQLLLCPEFVDSLTVEEFRYVLFHEVLHVALHHITGRQPAHPSQHYIHNVAADMAINSHIENTASRRMPVYKEDQVVDGKVVAKAGDRIGILPNEDPYNFEAKLTLENYFHLLMEKYPPQPCPVHGGGPKSLQGEKEKGEGEGQGQEPGEGQGEGQGEGTPSGTSSGHGHGGQGPKCTCQHHVHPGGFDNHDGWGESEIVDMKIRDRIDRLDKTEGWGNVSADFREMIRAAQVAHIPWHRYLRQAYGALIASTFEPTLKRPNRRFGYPFSGRKPEPQDRILVSMDTSGSVDKDELSRFLSETNSLCKSMPVDLMLFDCDLQYKKAIPFDRKKASIEGKGGGGTDFQCVIDYAKENKYRSLVIFTDGYAADPTQPKGVNVLWVITPGGKCSVPWGKKVQITD